MPWKVRPVSEIRFAACHAVRSLNQTVAAVARAYNAAHHQNRRQHPESKQTHCRKDTAI